MYHLEHDCLAYWLHIVIYILLEKFWLFYKFCIVCLLNILNVLIGVAYRRVLQIKNSKRIYFWDDW